MNLGNALGLPADVFRYQPDARLILPDCRIGMEFEFEGVTVERLIRGDNVGRKPSHIKDPWAQYWLVKYDGSLHDNGCEYLFSRPLFGMDCVDAFTNLCSYAKQNEYKVSIRTGFHVHVDMRDMTRQQLAVHNVLYALFERAVYRLAGNNREENVFCLPWYKADAMSNHVNNINSDRMDIRAASEALGDEKYGGLNLDCLARFGSVEWRHALATTDAEWVLKWTNLCLAFKRAAQKLNATPLEIIHNLSGVGPDNLARIVFEDMYDTIWYPDLQHDVWATGVETALLIYPKQQELIDKANLSWNLNKVPDKQEINPKFKSFVDRAIAKKTVPEPLSADKPFVLNRAILERGIAMDFEVRPVPAIVVEDDVVDDDDDGDEFNDGPADEEA